ncbi:Retrovirus-related Pol polyprotein from type-1 retrotransposable element R2 [Euphorbia peplus]|nr:Retrovirus-related Pol polyprotein from type-1 retrotransposable element R2 [Euphorbia peplus]
MPALFYQSYWNLIGADVQSFILEFFNSGIMPDSLNHTLVCLIPKKSKPTSMKDLRPISLCNVLYKLISKVLANRLKRVLSDVIDPAQSAFVSGRLITDNALIAFELFHTMKHRILSSRGNFALKLDMSKAYDRVEWSFLERVMKQMRFPHSFIKLIMSCLSSVSFSFLINGKAAGYMIPSRGLRQGDPLSPYLFVLCAEALSALTRRSEMRKEIHGVKASRYGPSVSHLLFADDSLFFARAAMDECHSIKQILSCYENASGQRINFDKTEIIFSKNVSSEMRANIRNFLEVKEVDSFQRYLGMPSLIGRSKKQIFSFIRDRIAKKLNGWKERNLSQAGKEVLIKAVAQSIPQYIMSSFALPITFCLELQQMIRKFWWGKEEGSKGRSWIQWNKLCLPKCQGGLGFRWLESFNLAFLAKQGWRLLTQPDSLCARILKAKYYPNSTFLRASIGINPSYTWRSILKGRPILEKGLCWRVGNGQSINIWEDNWISTQSYKKPLVRSNVLPSNLVQCLIDPDHRCWNREAVQAAFLPSEVAAILSIPISYRLPEDIMFWSCSKNGVYSVKSGYQQAESIRRSNEGSSSTLRTQSKIWRIIWQSKVPPKVKLFSWKAVHNALPTLNELFKRGINVEDYCCFCGSVGETLSHILCSCFRAKEIWKLFNPNIRIDKLYTGSIETWLLEVFSIVDAQTFNSFMLTIWMIWFNRNRLVHGVPPFTASDLLNKVRELIDDYNCSLEQAPQVLAVNSESFSKRSWSPPIGESYKLNCDAAIIADKFICSLGMVIRNASGQPMVSACFPNVRCNNVAEAEALAVLYGIKLALDCSLYQLEVETDSSSVVHALQDVSPYRNELGLICEDIRCLTACFSCITFNHVSRDANGLAHSLAHFASSLDNFIICMESVPPSCIPDLCKDGFL